MKKDNAPLWMLECCYWGVGEEVIRVVIGVRP